MKWHNDSYNNTKIKKIPHRLLKVNDKVYDYVFESGGEYFLAVRCGVTTYSKNHNYKNFIHDGYQMIYELPAGEQKDIPIDLKDIENFLQENQTVISSVPGSNISLSADINTEYIAHRQLDQSILIKYDNDSLKDFPMDTRNYNENIIVERLINNTDKAIGYQKDDKYYFDIKENQKYLKVIEDGKIDKDIDTDNNAIILPHSLASNIAWNTEQGTAVAINDTVENESLQLVEI